MAYVAIAGIAPQYENYANWWLKAYEQGTTTPLAMSLDALGSVTVAKLELDSFGFINTTGSARVIPYVSEAYDLWLIPTEAEADSNTLTNAVQVADNIAINISLIEDKIGFYRVANYTDLAALSVVTLLAGQIVTITNDGISGPGVLINSVGHGITTEAGLEVRIDDDWYWSRIERSADIAFWGGKGDSGTTNNSVALQAAIADGVKNIKIKSAAGSYKFLSATDVTTNFVVDMDDDVVIDCTDASFTGDHWLSVNGSTTALPDIASNVVAGARSIVFASAPSLAVGDVFIIFNPTNSSWSGFRTVYFAGEFCRVTAISGSTVTIAERLYDSYEVADVDLYKLNGSKASITGGNINGDVSLNLISLVHCMDSTINIRTATHSNNSCVTMSRCYNIDARADSIRNEGDGGDDYGLAINNSQKVRVLGGDYFSRRHGVKMGGGGSVGSVPTRNVRVIGANISNEAGVHSADFHGNCEDCQYIESTIYGGAAWQGKNNGYVDCDIYAIGNGSVLISAEILGGRHYLKDCRLYTEEDPQPTGRAVVDVGGNSIAISENTIDVCHFSVTGTTLNSSALSGNTTLFNMVNRGSAVKINYKIDNVDFNVNNLSSVLATELSSGTAASDYFIVDNITALAITGKPLTNHIGNSYRDFPHRLPTQRGVETITTTTSTDIFSSLIGFKWNYPRAPIGVAGRSPDGSGTFARIGGVVGITYIFRLQVDDIQIGFGTADDSNWGAGTTLNLNWSVGINEV